MSKHYNQYVFISAVRDSIFIGYIAIWATMSQLPSGQPS